VVNVTVKVDKQGRGDFWKRNFTFRR
jgi:hypothetical protein